MRGSGTKEERVKKPSNAFMIYRSEKVSEIVEAQPESRKEQTKLSKAIGEMWRQESDEVKATFIARATVEKHEFELANPDYKYGPNPERARRKAAAAAKAQAKFNAKPIEASAKPPRNRRGIKRNADTQGPADDLHRGSFNELVEAAATAPYERALDWHIATPTEYKVARHSSPPVAQPQTPGPLKVDTSAQLATPIPSGTFDKENASMMHSSPDASEHALFVTRGASGVVTHYGKSTQVLPIPGLGEGQYVVVQAGPPESPVVVTFPVGSGILVNVIKQEVPPSPTIGSSGSPDSSASSGTQSVSEQFVDATRPAQRGHDWLSTVLGPSEPQRYDEDVQMEYESEDD